jgi:hypothetical protein
MPFLPRNPGGPKSDGATQVSISKAYGGLVLLALLILVAMRHLFGSIRVEGGVH